MLLFLMMMIGDACPKGGTARNTGQKRSREKASEKDEYREKDKIAYIYRAYHGDLLRFARALLRRAGLPNVTTDAEDVVQNAFLKIIKYEKNVDFDKDDGELRQYVFTVVYREAQNRICRQMEEQSYVDQLDDYADAISDDEFLRSLDIQHTYERVVEIIKSMDERYSLPLYFCFCVGMTVKQVSDMLDIPEKTVYTRLTRGKQQLLELVKEEFRL